MNYKLIFKTAVLAGEIMLSNGAETYRAEDTINRILKITNFKVIESFVAPTGIFVTLDDPTIDMITYVKRVNIRTTHLNRVSLANDVSRKLCNGQISVEDAYNKLEQIKKEPTYCNSLTIIGIAFTSAFFSIVFGGSIVEFFICLINGFFLGFLKIFLNDKKITPFFLDLLGSMLITIIGFLCSRIIIYNCNFDIIIISSIMPMVPGVAITNAIRDTMQGDLISGVSRCAEAIFVASAIAVGVGTGLGLLSWLLGGI